MAHVAKYTRAEAGHLCKHYERAKDDQGEYLKFGNQDIDATRTPQNYSLGPLREQGQMDFLRQRCSEVVCMKRKDVNVMCSWIVTAPTGIAGGEHEREFFQRAYDFLSEKYGQENVISAHVHKDEITPHMHFAFVPVVHDKKRDRLKVSAKECITRTHLQTFHDELDRHMQQTMGERYPGGILNEATKEGNRSIEELKRTTATERLKELRQAEQKAAKSAQKEQDKVKHLQGEIKALERQLGAYTSTIGTVYEIEAIGKKSALTGKITMTAEEATQLKKQAAAYYAAESRAKSAEQTAARLKQRYANLEQDAPRLQRKIIDLTRERDAARKERNEIRGVVESSPQLVEAFNAQVERIREAEQQQRQKRQRGHDFGMSR